MADNLFDVGKQGCEKIKANSSAKNKERLMDMYGDIYRPEFEENMQQKVPRHPWHIFKDVRKEIKEIYEGQERGERVFVAERLFKQYKRKWEAYRTKKQADVL